MPVLPGPSYPVAGAPTGRWIETAAAMIRWAVDTGRLTAEESEEWLGYLTGPARIAYSDKLLERPGRRLPVPANGAN